MAIRHLGKVTAAVIALSLPGLASAWTLLDDFGPLPEATWGGTGIPNDAVASSKQFTNGTNEITLGLVAHERFSNPTVTNNGAGIYFAPETGSNFGGAGESGFVGAKWNFGYYIDIAGGGKLTDYQIDLYYDFDPAATPTVGDIAGLGTIDITAALGASTDTRTEGSQNLLFAFLGTTGSITGLTAPTFPAFDADVPGNYQFVITVATLGGFPIDAVAMEVQVVPVPAAVWLFGSALGLLGWVRRRTA